MEEDRSKSFQKNIAEICNSLSLKNDNFLIIMTTSMIASELDIESYTIGKFYEKNDKSLKKVIVKPPILLPQSVAPNYVFLHPYGKHILI